MPHCSRTPRRLGAALLAALLPAAAAAAPDLAPAAPAAPPPSAARAVEVTVRVGERAVDLGRRLKRLGLGSPELLARIARREALEEYPFLPPPGSGERRFEGMFPPGRHRVEVPAGPAYAVCLAVVRDLLEGTRRRLEGLSPENGLGLFGTMVLASLVEKEDPSRSRYGLVASVFDKRLRHGVRLASCPSVEYALGYHRPWLLRSDLAVDSPYNTYRRAGLPPGPVCFFSDEALRAAADPPASPHWFFLFDWEAGELVFSASEADHERSAAEARRRYALRHGAASLHRKHPGRFYEPVDGVRAGADGTLAQPPPDPLR